jgi:hypothetical protein
VEEKMQFRAMRIKPKKLQEKKKSTNAGERKIAEKSLSRNPMNTKMMMGQK